MNVAELKELLENMDDGDEVRIAIQPHYPLALHIAGVVAPESEDKREEVCQHQGTYFCGGLVHLVNDEWHHNAAHIDSDHEPEVFEDEGDESSLPLGIVWIVAGDSPDQPYAPRSVWANL